MSNIISMSVVRAQNAKALRVAKRNNELERGSATAEWAATALVGVAFAMCVFTLITHDAFGPFLTTLISGVLGKAGSLITN